MYVTRITNRTYIKVNRVDLGSGGAKRFTANVASPTGGGTIELRLDSLEGLHLGNLTISKTGGWDEWQEQSVSVSGATGTHDLYLVFRGNGDAPLFNFDYWTFSR
jgi:arabinoxylan arabinofuranohydrolase